MEVKDISIKLFSKYDLSKVLANQNKIISDKIENLTNDEILANDIEVLAENFFQEYFIECIVIMEEDVNKRVVEQVKVKKYIEPFFRNAYGSDTTVVDGYRFKFFYPYAGDKLLFECQASTFSLSGYPSVELDNKYIEITIEKTIHEMEVEGSKEKVLNELNNNIESIKSGSEYCNQDVRCFNDRLKESIINRLEEKRKKVSAYYDVAKMFEVPVNRNNFAETHISVKRKIAPISHEYNKESYYCITDKDYEDIIDAIKHTASTYERTPSSYTSMHEEDLRNTLLATLNAMYHGGVMGEAFRHTGKTDIAIERNNRAAFVAECKMWTGKKDISSAINQLDSYLTWRDCKAALIYFVRRKDFMKVLTAAEDELKQLQNVRRFETIDKNEFKLTIASENNVGQLVNIRVLLFNLYYKA